MLRFLAQRLLAFVPTMLGIALIVFLVLRLIPGDTISAQFGTQTILTEAQRAALLEYYGLDKPVLEQFVRWLGSVAQGNLGVSARNGKAVLGEILNRFPLTLELTFFAVALALIAGIPIGIYAAKNRGSFLDAGAQFLALIGLAVPNFWLGTLIILGLSVVFGVLPNSGDYVEFRDDPVGNLRQLLFPAITLGFAFMATVARTTRSAVLEELRQDYARTARSKGLAENAVLMKHCLRNALIPIITVTAIQTGYLLGGAVVVEAVYALPGVGQLLLNAINQRDYAVVQGTVLFIALGFLFVNLIADVLYAAVNPRVRR